MENKLQRTFARDLLPWLVVAGAAVLYLVTLNRSLSLSSAAGLARMVGWDSQPVVHAPLFALLTYPIRWLPGGLQLAAGGLFSLVCAVLALGLLARSVALLPHDRTREQRLRELGEHSLLDIPLGWVAPLLAVLVCGLQLSFWENATIAGGEMLDLLLFAYVIRCLLEYRLDGRESWLSKLALVYGLGVTNNWAMIGFFPAVLAALVWIMGLNFFRYRFLVRTTLLGLAGLLLYLLLPLVQMWSDPGHGEFFETLRSNLGFQKHSLTLFRPYMLVLLSLGSLLPILIIGIRWPASMGDISAAGFVAATVMIYVVHAAFLAICIYTAFDPPVSPRQLAYGSGVPMLTLYYLGALCVGYFWGFFLLLLSRPGERIRQKRTESFQTLSRVGVALLAALAVAVPAGLCWRNAAQILARNSDELSRFGRTQAEALPASGAVVLSDDPARLYAVRAALGSRAPQFVLLDTRALEQPFYHRRLAREYGARLSPPVAPATGNVVPGSAVITLLRRLASQGPMYYLHPSFGEFFEHFYLVPEKAVYAVRALATNTVEPPRLTPAQIQAQEDYWQKLDQAELAALEAKVKRFNKTQATPRKGRKERFLGAQRGEATPLWVASYYSRARNHWGVELAVNGQIERATNAYQQALELNPANPCAFVNLEWSEHYLKTGKLLERFSDDAMAKLAPFAGNWDLLLSLNGPVDEPAFRSELAQVLSRNGLSRQAAQQVIRLMNLNRKDLAAMIMLGNIYVMGGMPEKAVELVNRIRSDPATDPKEPRPQLELALIEAMAAYASDDLARAESLLRAAQDKHPQYDGAFFTLAQIYISRADALRAEGKTAGSLALLTNAIQVFEKQLRLQPANVPAMVNYGGVCAHLQDYNRAISILTRAIQTDPKNQPARLNRAIANLRANREDAARQDYEELLKLDSSSYQAYYGLADLAYRKSDWYGALNNFELYLRNAPKNTPEYLSVEKRVAELKKKARL